MINQSVLEEALTVYKKKLTSLLDEVEERYTNGEVFYPFVTQNGKWVWGDKWSNAFLPGQLWLFYYLNKDEKWKRVALKYTRELEHYKNMGEFQDIGFIFTYSFVLGHRITKDEYLKDTALEAAYNLFNALMPGGYLQCNWLEQGKRINGIDNMMNIQLWLWAYEVTNDPKFLNGITSCIKTTQKTLFNKDGSSYEYALVDEYGTFVKAKNKNSATPNSVWTRGHIWGIYGLVQAYLVLKDDSLLSTIKNLTTFFVKNTNDDYVPSWDLLTKNQSELVDSSAGAAAATSFLQLADYLIETGNKDSEYFLQLGTKLLSRLLGTDYLSLGVLHEGILLHASSPLRFVDKAGESQIWGDYFLLEAIKVYIRIYKKEGVTSGI